MVLTLSPHLRQRQPGNRGSGVSFGVERITSLRLSGGPSDASPARRRFVRGGRSLFSPARCRSLPKEEPNKVPQPTLAGRVQMRSAVPSLGSRRWNRRFPQAPSGCFSLAALGAGFGFGVLPFFAGRGAGCAPGRAGWDFCVFGGVDRPGPAPDAACFCVTPGRAALGVVLSALRGAGSAMLVVEDFAAGTTEPFPAGADA
jgi:hypothetical protein